MNRSGYTEVDDWGDEYQRAVNLYRGVVASSIRGRRGQRMLRELRDALDAMPVKRLAAEALETDDGEVCALGCLGRARGLDMSDLDAEDAPLVAAAFDISETLAREVAYQNDESANSPEGRWLWVRAWCERHIKEAP